MRDWARIRVDGEMGFSEGLKEMNQTGEEAGAFRPLRILIVSRGIPVKDDPMLGIFEWDQAKALRAMGHEVTFFAVDLRSARHKRSFGIYQRDIQGIRVFVYSMPVGAVSPGILVKLGFAGLKKLFLQAFSPEGIPDVIHAHFTEMGCMAAELSEKTGVPLVITEHSSIMGGEAVPAKLLQVAKKGYEAADGLIAVSGALSRKILEHTGAESRVIHNIIDDRIFRRYPAMEHEGYHFISVSNLIPRKRISLLLEAFAVLTGKTVSADAEPETGGNDGNRGLYLDIVGDGEERENLENLADQLGIRDRVYFHGRLSRKDIAKQFSMADCFVLPSELETFGVVYAEAMMAGLPVIATACGGPEDFVTGETGLIGEYDTGEALAGAMEEMYQNRERFDRDAIQGYAQGHFSPEVIAERLTKEYLEIL